jgi:hypothetical protein
MSEMIVPHFHNDPGVSVIEIGAREFMCVGASPPLDHPHVYRFDPTLSPRQARPPECALPDLETA